MKNYVFRWVFLPIILLALLSGCSKKSTEDPQTVVRPGTAAMKLMQDGQVLVDIKTLKSAAVGGGSYAVDISSTDEKNALSLSINGEAVGNYPFINSSQTLTPGKANFTLYSFALPAAFAGTAGILIPESGEAVVKTATKSRVSGTFQGSGKNVKDGKTYTLEGTFDAPVF
ncbi:hypothetical protein [Persicitalea sp.]|uniref:hypothetical protein n=1 Tax=Persicitalea sp. TaxID=3100273 RepID=UPI0035934635